MAAIVAALVAACVLFGPAWADAADELRVAQKAMRGGRYGEAEQALARVRKVGRRAQLLKTKLYLWTGRYQLAIREAKRGQALGKKAKRQIAPWHADALVRTGKLDEAVSLLRTLESDDKAHRAHLVLGALLIRQGKRQEADGPLNLLVSAYNSDAIGADDPEGLTLVARAVYLLRAYQNANQAFDEAERAGGKKRVETLLARAELFLDKYNPARAGEVAREALALAPTDPRSLILMARVKLEQSLDFRAAEELIEKALKVDPHLAEAHFVRAGLALRTMDLEGADKALDTGLAMDPNNLELLSMKAATRFLADDKPGFARFEQRILGLNPQYSTLYSIVGTFANWEHRYDDIVVMMKKAVALDDDDAKAYAQLGMNLIRAGREKEGLEALNKAWRRDKFNVRVFNLLNLYEEKIAKEYVTVEGTTFRIRYNKIEKPVLERYVPSMLKRAWSSMVKRYGFTPQTPVGIELYADSESFSIRTSGLPNVGIQGVCFGKTLAALSPGAGQFNWGMILWHELAHVFHIQRSKSHVPRWFTEGLAEYETIIERPEWQREEHLALFEGLRQGKVPKVASFNRAFTHVDDPRDITMAYFAASQISVFMAKEFGFERVASMLSEWASGARTEAAVKASLGVDADELDRRYRVWLKKQLQRYDQQFVPDIRPPRSLEKAKAAVAKNPEDAFTLMKLALAFLQEGKKREAMATLSLASQKDPKEPNVRYLKLTFAVREEDPKEAKKLVAGLIKDGHDGYAVRMKAGDIAEREKDVAGMKRHYNRAYQLDPSQAEPVQALYDVAHKDGDKAGELWALRELSRLEQHDRQVWLLLLKRLIEVGRWEEAVKVGASAVYIDVMNPEMHRLYARALARTGRHISAIFELNSALKARPEPKAAAKIYGMLADGYTALKRPKMAAEAKRYAEEVLATAPREGSRGS
ncbi:MAG: tetratricopeptide repeat protein [Myxococcota bacterium]